MTIHQLPDEEAYKDAVLHHASRVMRDTVRRYMEYLGRDEVVGINVIDGLEISMTIRYDPDVFCKQPLVKRKKQPYARWDRSKAPQPRLGNGTLPGGLA